jgi:hypothetical protein
MKIIITNILLFCTVIIANAQQNNVAKQSLKEALIGTWTLVSVDNIYPDSSRVHPYGDNPQGLLIFDVNGNYAIQILNAKRAKVISGDKNKCTPEENAELVMGSNSHFGKYYVDESTNTITFNIDHAFFPNWEGTIQKRTYIYTGNIIKYVVTHTTQGGQAVVAEVAWQRLN